MCWDGYDNNPTPVKKRILFAVKDQIVAAKLRADMADQTLTTIAPDLDCFEKDFDVIMVCFEPTMNVDQVWFHTKVTPLLAVNGVIYFAI